MYIYARLRSSKSLGRETRGKIEPLRLSACKKAAWDSFPRLRQLSAIDVTFRFSSSEAPVHHKRGVCSELCACGEAIEIEGKELISKSHVFKGCIYFYLCTVPAIKSLFFLKKEHQHNAQREGGREGIGRNGETKVLLKSCVGNWVYLKHIFLVEMTWWGYYDYYTPYTCTL